MNQTRILAVAVPVPLRQLYDFLVPESLPSVVVGSRVKVPFGARKLIGIVVEIKGQSDYPIHKLKCVLEVLDDDSLFEPELWTTLQWLSRYYLAPVGEVFDLAIPSKLRQGTKQTPASEKSWSLTDQSKALSINDLQRAPLQQAIIKRLSNTKTLKAGDFKNDSSSWRQAIKALIDKQWLTESTQLPYLDSIQVTPEKTDKKFSLNQEQQTAIDVLSKSVKPLSFSCSLLHGVTGSGKTEVYFDLMEQVLEQSKQVLFLVPEIGLTPQLLERIGQRFDCAIASLHSGLNDSERHLAWWHAKQGNAKIIVGTRSAVFCSFNNLGMIVVDEEHDSSFKQQEGVRYQARNVAIYRARQHKIPIVLGSATPCLESYLNAQQGKYQYLQLRQRATKALLPKIELLDTTLLPVKDGLSPPMVEAISKTLSHGKQAMLFLNRRGYAPALYCKDCNTASQCHRCDSNLTLHRRDNKLRCHHCGHESSATTQCNSCQSSAMVEVGDGTQRVEEALRSRFPNANILRIDRDSTRRKGDLAKLLNQAKDGKADILLGTQLLTKGHDFPNIDMVGVLGADQGLYSIDFRASETLFQQLLQVSGRAGRREKRGHVYIQTAFPQHPFFAWVQDHNFVGFAKSLLTERESAEYPPYTFFALLRAESHYQAKALQFLRKAKHDIRLLPHVRVMDAIPAPMERRAGKYRAQLLLSANQRSSLNGCLADWLDHIATDKGARTLANSVRWSLDIDPFDHY